MEGKPLACQGCSQQGSNSQFVVTRQSSGGEEQQDDAEDEQSSGHAWEIKHNSDRQPSPVHKPDAAHRGSGSDMKMKESEETFREGCIQSHWCQPVN